MNEIKKIANNFLASIIFLMASILVISILSYFNIINGKLTTITQLSICFISLFIAAFRQGKCSNKQGYLEGMKIGGLYLLLFIISNLIFCQLFQLKNYIYYLLIIIISAFGGMIGISKKKNNR